MLNILLITSSSSHGGGPKNLYDICSSLNNKYNFYIASPTDYPYYEKFRNLIGDRHFPIPNRKFNIFLAISLLIFLLKNKINIIHTHGKGASTYGRFCRLFTGVKLIHTSHGIQYKQYSIFKKYIYIYYEIFSGWLCNLIIYVSTSEKKIANSLRIWKNIPFEIINNGVPIINNKFLKSRLEFNLNKNDFVVINISRFDVSKNIFEAIHIAEINPDIKFLFVGHGPDWDKINSYIIKKNINNVILTGFIDKPQELLILSDLYLSTSRWEGLPISILEAMSVSLPIVASNVEGNADILQNSNCGYLYTLGDIKDASRCIRLIKDNQQLRNLFSINSINAHLRFYSLDLMIKKITKIYDEI